MIHDPVMRAQCAVMHVAHTCLLAPYQTLANTSTQLEMLPVILELHDIVQDFIDNPRELKKLNWRAEEAKPAQTCLAKYAD
eukprot:SAG31_NODE_9247_length_1308_cov_2.200165_1_plen_81_part_00